jgi:hypothetical protein
MTLSMEEHSSLSSHAVSDEEKEFYNADARKASRLKPKMKRQRNR